MQILSSTVLAERHMFSALIAVSFMDNAFLPFICLLIINPYNANYDAYMHYYFFVQNLQIYWFVKSVPVFLSTKCIISSNNDIKFVFHIFF